MTGEVLLDTSVIIDFLRQKNKQDTLLYKLSIDSNLYISIITHAELYAGKSVWANKTAKKELGIVFEGMSILQIDNKISEEAGKIRAKYDLDLIDALIAATSISNEIPLATFNFKHFKKVPSLKFYTFKLV